MFLNRVASPGLANRFGSMLRVAGYALAVCFTLDALARSQGRAGIPLSLPALVFTALAVLAFARRMSQAPMSPARLSAAATVALLVIPAAASFAFYGPVVGTWFIADDLRFVNQWSQAGFSETLEWWWPPRDVRSQFLRPLPRLAGWVLLHLFDRDPVPLHLFNISLHAAASGLVAWMVASLSARNLAGLFAGVLFAVEPLAVTTVAWIDKHEDSAALFFSVGSLAALTLALGGGRRARTVSLIAYSLGLLSKELAISVPVAALALVWFFDPGARSVRGLVRALLPYLVVTLFYLGWRFVVFHGPGGYVGSGGSSFSALRAGTLAGVFAELPQTLTLPANAAIVANASALHTAAVGFAVLALTLALRARDPRAAAVAGFGLVWLAASLVPIHSLIWMGPHLLNARYLYPTSAAFVLVVTGLAFCVLERERRSPWPSSAVAGLVVAVALGAFFPLALANRAQWLALMSVPQGIAADIKALDRIAPVDSVEFLGFPVHYQGSFLFDMAFLPELALGREVSSVSRRADGIVERSGRVARAPRLRVVYRWLGGERLWRRERVGLPESELNRPRGSGPPGHGG